MVAQKTKAYLETKMAFEKILWFNPDFIIDHFILYINLSGKYELWHIFNKITSPSYWVPSKKAGRKYFMHIMARPLIN